MERKSKSENAKIWLFFFISSCKHILKKNIFYHFLADKGGKRFQKGFGRRKGN